MSEQIQGKQIDMKMALVENSLDENTA